MTVPAKFIAPAINKPNPRVPMTGNTQTDTGYGGASGAGGGTSGGGQQGQMTYPTLQMLQQIVTAINGLTPIIACNATFNSNKYTLTPVIPAPAVPNYIDFVGFAFVAPASSTGLVTATIVPKTGTLATIKVFKTNGSAQATSGDITINLFYIMYFVDSLDSGNGGFVLK